MRITNNSENHIDTVTDKALQVLTLRMVEVRIKTTPEFHELLDFLCNEDIQYISHLLNTFKKKNSDATCPENWN